MSICKKGDIVVMNTDRLGKYYIGEQLTYIGTHLNDCSMLKNIHNHYCTAPNDSFDLRDKSEFEIDELIEVSNTEEFFIVEKVYFVADASKVKSYDGDYPIVTASDMGTIQNYKYARKTVEKIYTIKYDCIEYPATKEQHDRYQALIDEVTA